MPLLREGVTMPDYAEMRRQHEEVKSLFARYFQAEADRDEKRDAIRKALGPFVSMHRILQMEDQQRRSLCQYDAVALPFGGDVIL